MKKSILGLLTLVALFLIHTTNAQSKEKASVTLLVQNYFEALNTGDASKATSMFTRNGVLLPQGAPTATGSEQIKGTFSYVFDNFSFSLKVNIDEIIIQDTYALVSSNSSGSFVIKAKNDKVTASYRETFIMQKEEGVWKIARYMYNQPQ